MKCLILAGGFGTRLYPLTINKAKALLDYQGKPLLSHLVEMVPHNIDVLVSINKRFESDFQGWRQSIDRPVEFCLEEACNNEQKKGAVSALNLWIKQKGITEDLLVIAGDRDSTVGMADKLELAERLPNARLEVISGSGHASPLDAPMALNRLLLEFFDQVERQGGATAVDAAG